MDNETVRLSLHFPNYSKMEEWVETVRQTGAFGVVQNSLVPSVFEPRKDIGIRMFDGIDDRRTKEHFTLDNSRECPPLKAEVVEDDEHLFI